MKIPRVTLIIPIALSSVISSTGCTSMSSTFMQRQEDDQLLGISNGKLGTHNHARPFKGIPVTLKVPTHLDLSIVETLLVVEKEVTVPDKPNQKILEVKQLESGIRNINIFPHVVHSDKVFTVDPKRPAAGNLDYTLQFDKDSQYFKSIAYHNVDETINDINAVIATLKPSNSEKKASPTTAPKEEKIKEENKTKDVKEITRTLAWKRFDLQARDLEEQIAVFVSEHLSDCQSCPPSSSDSQFLHGSQTTPPNPVQVKLSDRKPLSTKNTTR
jgi:hypothetical protein